MWCKSGLRLAAAILLKSKKRQPESTAAAGRVKTQARAMSRMVESCRPLWLAAMVPATPELRTWVVLTGRPNPSARADGDHGGDFGRRALGIGQVSLADLFADRDHDALPADHGAEAERERYGHLDPGGNELGGLVEELFVVGQDGGVRSGDLGRTGGLGQQRESALVRYIWLRTLACCLAGRLRASRSRPPRCGCR